MIEGVRLAAKRALLAAGVLLLGAVAACSGGSGHPDAADGPGRRTDGGTPGVDGRGADAGVDRATSGRDGAPDQARKPDGGARDAHLSADGFVPDGLPPCTAPRSYSAADSAAFFPYQVGARWRFQTTGTTNSEPSFSPTTFLQERTVTGTRAIGSATALVVQTSNTVENDGPVEQYLVVGADGLVDDGTNAPKSILSFEGLAAPYTQVPFPVDGCASVMTVDRTGLDAGQDIDGDGINETVSLYAVTVLRVEDVSVPVGTFPDALRVETATQITVTESKTGAQLTSTGTQVDWYAAGVGPVKRWWNTGSRTYDYELIAYSVGGVSRGVLPSGALARDLPQSASNPYQPNRPAIGFDGSRFLVVIPTAIAASSNYYQANLQPFVITPGAAPQMGSPLLPTGYPVTGVVTAFNGTEHMLAFNHNDVGTVEVMPVGTTGATLGNPVTVSNNMAVTAGIEESSGSPAIVNTASGFLVGYLKIAVPPGGAARQTNLWMVPVSTTGVPGSYVEPFPSAPQGAVALATDGSTILAVWVQAGALLQAARFDATGHPLDTTPLLVSSGQADSVSDVELVFDGTNFVALWKDNRGSTGGGATRVARISKGLTLLDGPAGGVTVGSPSTVRTGPRLARLGAGSLVIWDGFSNSPSLTGVAVARFTSDGHVLDTQGLANGIFALGSILGGPPFDAHPLPEILWGGDRALLVWLYPPSASQAPAFGLDYGFAFPWSGGSGAGGTGGSGAGGAGGGGGMGGAGGQATTCGFTMPNPSSTALPNAANYDTRVAGTVADQVSGLDWERQPSGASAAAGCTLDGTGLQLCPPAAAAAYCAANRLGGFSDWRLPTLLELYSLVDYTATGTAIDPSAFPGTPATLFWSATPSTATATRNWTVDFKQATVQTTSTQESHNVRCVRGAPPHCFPSGTRYQVANDLATDRTTGLVWQSYGGASGLTWMAATSYCASLGMRLPSVKESLTILDFTQSVSTGSLIDRTAFTKLGSGFWWTSSVDLSQYMSAWSLDVEDGGLAAGNYYGGATETHCIR